MRPFNNNTHLPFSQRQIFTLLFVWFLVISILLTFESTSALQGASEMETGKLKNEKGKKLMQIIFYALINLYPNCVLLVQFLFIKNGIISFNT